MIEVRPNPSMLTHQGTYGEYGGAYIPPVLEKQLQQLADFFDNEV